MNAPDFRRLLGASFCVLGLMFAGNLWAEEVPADTSPDATPDVSTDAGADAPAGDVPINGEAIFDEGCDTSTNMDRCLSKAIGALQVFMAGHQPISPTKYGVPLPDTDLTEAFLADLQDRREKFANSCLVCEGGKCKFSPELEPLTLGYCVATFAMPKRRNQNLMTDTLIRKNRVYTVGFRIGKTGRPVGVRVRRIQGGQTNRRDANKFMKSVLTSYAFEPIVVAGEKLELEGVYIVIDTQQVRRFT